MFVESFKADKGNNKITEQTDKISQQPENWENRNGPDLVQAFPKKWWVDVIVFISNVIMLLTSH
jgi:hypothetical protein